MEEGDCTVKKRTEEIKISVIIPIYNTKDYLEECIASVRGQSHKNLEIILVDDGSTDGSAQICDRHAKEDERIRVVHKEQGGICSARNCGLDMATGDYIAFVDSDDYILPDMYSVLLQRADDTGADLAMCSYLLFHEKGEQEEPDHSILEEQMDSMAALHVLHTKQRISMIVPWNKLCKAELYEGVRCPEKRSIDDEFVNYKLLWKTNKICYVNRAFYMFRQRESSNTHTPSLRKYLDYMDALIERHQYFSDVVKDERFLEEDALFCMEELCNVHFKDCTREQLKRYHREYVKMYEKCTNKGELKAKKRIRYFAAAHFSDVMIAVWKMKKKLKG